MKYYGQDAIGEIEKNPYILLDITYGVDFTKIDKMAMDLGINIDDEKRIESAIKYSLGIASNNGNTAVAKENLIQFVQNLLNSSLDSIKNAIINLNVKKEIVVETQNEEWVYLNTFYVCEKNIAEKLIALNKANNSKKINNFDKKLHKVEKLIDLTLSEKQEQAIKLVNDNNVCVITGGPRHRKNYNNKIYNRYVQTRKKESSTLCSNGKSSKKND